MVKEQVRTEPSQILTFNGNESGGASKGEARM